MYERTVSNDDIRDFAYRLAVPGPELEYISAVYRYGYGRHLRQSFRPQAERQVKVRLALEKIAELEDIQPTDEET